MIGLRGLPDGGHLLEHPDGPLWVLVRKGRIVRGEIYQVTANRLRGWPNDNPRPMPRRYLPSIADFAGAVIRAT